MGVRGRVGGRGRDGVGVRVRGWGWGWGSAYLDVVVVGEELVAVRGEQRESVVRVEVLELQQAPGEYRPKVSVRGVRG